MMLYLTFSGCSTQIQMSAKLFTFKKKPEAQCLILEHTILLPLAAVNSELSCYCWSSNKESIYRIIHWTRVIQVNQMKTH